MGLYGKRHSKRNKFLSTRDSGKKHIKHLYGQQIVMILLSGRIHKEKNVVLFELLDFFFFLRIKKKKHKQEQSYKECGLTILTLEMLGLC